MTQNLLTSLLDSLKSAAYESRESVREIDQQIAALRKERDELLRMPPHLEDLTDWLCRNIDRHRSAFLQRANSYLHPQLVKEKGWSAFSDNEAWVNGFAVFRLDGAVANVKGYVTPPDRDGYLQAGDFEARAIVALLAEPIKKEAKKLILDLLPDSDKGMRKSEFDRRLSLIDEKIAQLSGRRGEIMEELRKTAEEIAVSREVD